MASTIGCKRGDVALVRFVFTDEQGAKRRPVVVLSSDDYHAGRAEMIVAAVTSNTTRVLQGDHPLDDWREAQLPKPSIVTGILRTIRGDMIERRLGTLSVRDLAGAERALRLSLGL